MRKADFLLTGGTGFLGKIILNVLSDHSFITLSRHSADIVCDLSSSTPAFEKNFSVTCVIHAAGKAHIIPKNRDEVEDFFQVNLIATKNLTHALSRLNQLPSQFIFISSVAVYGRESGELIDEEQPLRGETPYAKSKIEAERFLLEWCQENNIKLTILRLPLVIGANPVGNLSAMIKWMNRGLYFGIGNGNNKRSMVLGTDVAMFLPKVALVGGVYNLTDGVNPTLREFENLLASKLGKRKPLRLPGTLLKVIAQIGDNLGQGFPLNTNRFEKLTSSLTFSDLKARNLAGWNPRAVINNL